MSQHPATTAIQRAIQNEYAPSVGLKRAQYFGGAPLRPVVPLDTAIGGFFILGAYPSARFEVVGRERDVPVGDNLGPFEPERYFDGDRVRTQASADELAQHYLKPLGIQRDECWVTDLVKVFLFKPGHRDKYARLKAEAPRGYERERFEELGRLSMPWIIRELEVAKPKLLVTLGAEVAGVVRGVKSTTARTALIAPDVSELRVGGLTVPVVHLAHPGIVMRKGGADSRNPWPARHANEHVPLLKKALAHL